MHHAGGSGGRKKALRCGRRQAARDARPWRADTSAWVSGKTSQMPRRLVLRRGDDALAVGAERRASTIAIMASERLADRLAGRRVPDPRRLVRRCGDDALAVGAERRAVTVALWPLSGSPIGLPRRGVPDARRLVPRCGDDAPAVRAERRADSAIMAS